jgi:hypothetical protein
MWVGGTGLILGYAKLRLKDPLLIILTHDPIKIEKNLPPLSWASQVLLYLNKKQK